MMFGFSQFFIGEERVTTELLPFAIAAPTDDAQVFLASQIADEARTCVFFDRFFREVLGFETRRRSPPTSPLSAPNTNDEFKQLFDGILHDCAETLRKDPSDMEALVRGITVYMIVIEGTLALTGARFILRSLKEMDRLPGLPRRVHRTSIATSRATSASGSSSWPTRSRPTALQAGRPGRRCRRRLPVGVLAFSPAWVEDRYDFVTPFYHSTEVFEYAMKSLSKKLAAMGTLDPWAPADAERAKRAAPLLSA